MNLEFLGNREGALVMKRERIYGFSQKIKGLVAMVCRMAFTQATVGSHQGEATHYLR